MSESLKNLRLDKWFDDKNLATSILYNIITIGLLVSIWNYKIISFHIAAQDSFNLKLACKWIGRGSCNLTLRCNNFPKLA